MSMAEGWPEKGKGVRARCGALARSRRLTGGPEVAPRVHSDLAGQAAGVREIPAEPGGTGSEHREEQEATDPPSALRPQGHGCGRARLCHRLCHRCTSLRRPPCLLLNPRPWGRSLPDEPAPARGPALPEPSQLVSPFALSQYRGFGQGHPRPASSHSCPSWASHPWGVLARAHHLQATDVALLPSHSLPLWAYTGLTSPLSLPLLG